VTPLTQHVKDLLGAPGGTPMDKIQSGQFGKDGASELPALKPGEGELHVVDRAFGANPALLVRGDTAGTAAALERFAALALSMGTVEKVCWTRRDATRHREILLASIEFRSGDSGFV
jgi:hypothetical protein